MKTTGSAKVFGYLKRELSLSAKDRTFLEKDSKPDYPLAVASEFGVLQMNHNLESTRLASTDTHGRAPPIDAPSTVTRTSRRGAADEGGPPRRAGGVLLRVRLRLTLRSTRLRKDSLLNCGGKLGQVGPVGADCLHKQ